MTKEEFNDLYEKLCYGHEAELLIDGTKYFIEWDGQTITVFRITGEAGEILFHISKDDRFKAVQTLFSTPLSEKCLNDDFSDIQILDIE